MFCLALIGLALFFSTLDPVAQAKKTVAPAGQSGEIQMQRTPVELIATATVNFAELAAQEALKPDSADFTPRAISPPKTIIEVDNGTVAPEPPSAGIDEIPGPLVPSPAPAQNYAALDDIAIVGSGGFIIPPDTMGAVGPDSGNRTFVTLNNNYRIQNKATGATISTVSMESFWAATGATGLFDPRVQYDPYNNRWIVAAVSNAASANTSILVGVSQTSDPGGAYFLFRIAARLGTDPANVNFADFPMLGFNRNYVVVSINMFSTTAFTDGRIVVLDYPQLRTNVVSGTYLTGITAPNGGFCIHPATTFSATENTQYLVSHISSASATYRLFTITGPANAPTFNGSAALTRPGGGWSQPGGNILPQAQGTCATTPLRMEAGDAFIRSNVVFRNGSIWYPQTIGLPAGGLTRTAAQWTQINTAGAFVQGGRVDDPTATATNGGIWYSYPSISVNANNDVLFGFSDFESDDFADAGYTFRASTDALGTMRDPFIYKQGEDCYSKDFGSGRNRWGDYSHTVIDPTNDLDFWTIQEYAKLQAPPVVGGSSSKWGTWWARVNALGTPGSLQFSSATYTVGEAGPTATITVTRTGGSSGTVTVNYNTSNGTATGGASCVAGVDFLNQSGTLTFVNGDVSETFTVPICNDTAVEGNETVNLALSAPTGGATLGTPNTAVLTITDNDTTTGLQYYPLPNPVRLLDTRPGQPACDMPGAPLTGGSTRTEPARIACTGIPANAQAIVGNATVVSTVGGEGFVTLFPSGAAQPTVSNLNFVAGQVVPNAFTVGLGNGDGAFNIFTSASTHFIVDVTGYYAPPGTGGLFYHPLPNPVRLLDTRSGQPACDMPGAPLTANSTRTEPARIACTGIPASAQAIVGNATVVSSVGGEGFITLYPSGAAQPTVSNLNFVAGQVVPNAFTVGLGSGNGAFNIFTSASTHFIVDVTGYYSDQATDVNGAGLFFNPLASPVRLLDTRPGQSACDMPGAPLTGGSTRTEPARIPCTGIPASAQAVVGNATVVSTVGGSGFITLFPSGALQPTVSNLNFVAGQIVPNAFTVGLGSGDGAFNIFTSASTHFIVDLSGYFAP